MQSYEIWKLYSKNRLDNYFYGQESKRKSAPFLNLVLVGSRTVVTLWGRCLQMPHQNWNHARFHNHINIFLCKNTYINTHIQKHTIDVCIIWIWNLKNSKHNKKYGTSKNSNYEAQNLPVLANSEMTWIARLAEARSASIDEKVFSNIWTCARISRRRSWSQVREKTSRSSSKSSSSLRFKLFLPELEGCSGRFFCFSIAVCNNSLSLSLYVSQSGRDKDEREKAWEECWGQFSKLHCSFLLGSEKMKIFTGTFCAL